MHLSRALSFILLASSNTFSRAEESEHHSKEDHHSSTITSSASLACATGEPRSKYEQCSSSVSSKIDDCNEDNYLECACSHANDGFGCLTSYCPSQTDAVCSASLFLANICALGDQSGPIFTHYTCPSTISDPLATLIPSELRSLIPTDVDSMIPTKIPFFNGVSETGTVSRSGSSSGGGSTTSGGGASGSSTGNAMTAPSQTGGASGRWYHKAWYNDANELLIAEFIICCWFGRFVY